MKDAPWDLITIGGGPAGLMCSITAVSGIPIDPPRHFSALVLDRGRIGQFARFGKLRLTYRWHFMGDHLIASLQQEAQGAGVKLREGEEVVEVELAGDVKLIRTTKSEYRARCIAICTGFFPHGDLLEHGDSVRPVFSPADLEASVIAADAGEQLLVLGGGRSTIAFAKELATLRQDLEVIVVVENEGSELTLALDAGLEAHHGRLRVARASREGLEVELLTMQGRRIGKRSCRMLLIDYNSYTTETAVTDFLQGSGLERRGGYVVTDSLGGTGIPGVVAAGNVVTPVSGALTALSTGFTAGLSAHRYLFERHFGRSPDFFPWLPREGLEAHPLAEGRAIEIKKVDNETI